MMTRLWRMTVNWLAGRRRGLRHVQRLEARHAWEGEQGFRLLAEHSGDMVCRLAMDGRQLYVSPAAHRIIGCPPHALVGRSILDTAVPEDRAALRLALARLLGRETAEASATYRAARPDGGVVWLEASLGALRAEASGAPLGLVAIIRDISDRKAEEVRLADLARRDELTGLANRRGLEEALPRAWHACASSGRPLSVLLLDVDRFKAFNDCHGHPRGDECLRAVAATVAATVRRRRDLACRYGGEEFLVVLPEVGAVEAEAVAERLRAAVEALALPHGGFPQAGAVVTASIGVATVQPEAGSAAALATLLSAADQALYEAKRGGRNRVAMAPREAEVVLPGGKRVAA